MKLHFFAPIVFFASALCQSVSADEVTDAIDEAVASYKAGDFSNAAAQLDYAASLVREQKAGAVLAVFSDPLDGWTAEEAESNSAAGMFMGGGITASRRYSKGDARVEVSLVMDSPMLQSVTMMLSNPAMMSMTGGKLVRVQGNKGMMQAEDERFTLNFVVNNNALFTLTGSDGATREDVLAYGEKLKLKALE